MRSHAQIITDSGGPSAVAALVGSTAGAAKQWRRTDSIPAPYWMAFAGVGLATLDELAAAAAGRIVADKPGSHDRAPVDDGPTLAPGGGLGAGAEIENVQ